MKRTIILLSVAVSLIMGITCCTPETEVYNPDCKIYKIWFYSNVDEADQVFSYDKKNLDRIDLKDTTYYTFEYNKEKTVSKIFHTGENYDESIQFTYLNNLVNRIIYTMNGAVRHEITFERDASKLSRIIKTTEIYDKEFFDSFELHSKAQLYKDFIGDPKQIQEIVSHNDIKNFSIKCTTDVEYEGEEGLNIVRTHSIFPDVNQEITTFYKYDSGINPYYGLTFAYSGLLGYSYNNKIEESSTTTTNGAVTSSIYTTFSYQYNDKNYPREFTTTSSVNNIPRKTYILYAKE